MSKKVNKIVLNRNNKAITDTKLKATNYLILLDRTKAKLKDLTEGNVEDLSMNEVDKYLNDKTGFLNGLMSATAFNLQEDYNALKTLINNVDNGVDNLQYIVKGKVDDAKIEEAHTSYLKQDYVDEYIRLQEAIEMLNKTSMHVLKGAMQLGRDSVVLNASAFQSAKLMSNR